MSGRADGRHGPRAWYNRGQDNRARAIGDSMMTSIRANVPAVADADQVPWYDLIDDVPLPLRGAG